MHTTVQSFNDPFSFDDDDESGWQEMPVVKEDTFVSGLDEEDQKKYHYVAPAKKSASSNPDTGNATGNLIDFDDEGTEWRAKAEQNENEYTRLRVNEEDEADEVHLRTRYLFDEDKAMTPLGQMQTTKNMLTEAQRIAYVGVCALTVKEMVHKQSRGHRKELKASSQDVELWALKIMGRLYYHMELETAEQKMIESLASHGVQASDLVPSLMTTRTVANPEYDPTEAERQADSLRETSSGSPDNNQDTKLRPTKPRTNSPARSRSPTPTATQRTYQTTSRVLEDTSVASSSLPGVTTSLSSLDKDVTLDIRWTVLCDLFLILIADSVYDARSRVLLENVALKLGLGWIDVVKFESRVTEALEIEEGVEKMDNQDIIDGSSKAARKKRYMMMGLATLGGGLVIGLSAGLLAPVIGAGLGAAFTTIGISGTTGFLASAGGAAVITTGGVITGSGIAVRGMARRTQQVRTFDVLPLHNNKRVSCILTVPGFMSGKLDDVRLPFSVLDPIVGDVFSVLWEPEMIQETGSALKILTGEILTQTVQTVLQHTVMTTLMGALQWPIVLTKLGYLIDNPWNNALDRARAAGSVLAQLLIQRHLGVRPITLIGFSLGARVIFYALLDLAKAKAFGIVQDVFMLGATLTATQSTWCQARSVVSGRFVNAYARNDWVLNYLFRAASGGLSSVAGLRPIEGIPGLENVDVTDKIAGHMSYRTFMPLILDQLGFPVSADHFDEPVEPEFKEERVVIREEERETEKKGWFGSRKKKSPRQSSSVSRPPSAASFASSRRKASTLVKPADDDLPPRTDATGIPPPPPPDDATVSPDRRSSDSTPDIPIHAGFDLTAMEKVIGEAEKHPEELTIPQASRKQTTSSSSPLSMPHSVLAPPVISEASSSAVEKPTPYDEESDAGPSSPSSLNARFASSVSLQDKDPYRRTTRADVEEAHFGEHDAFTRTPSRPPTTAVLEVPRISFGGSDGSIWSSNASTATLGNSSGMATYSTVSFGNGHGTRGTTPSQPSLSRNPFTAAVPSSSVSMPYTGSSSDGNMMTLQGLEQDPWSAAPLEAAKTSLDSNPWSS
ncbi:hypothetical protein F5I97DRAFT_1830131 [Phlebopus sp. FC_14]|nr:hypothetical protein F5I97DRAFT_1830131 [Phlebopus sp. FC_14]